MEDKLTGRFDYIGDRIWSKISWAQHDLSESRRKLPRFKWAIKW